MKKLLLICSIAVLILANIAMLNSIDKWQLDRLSQINAQPAMVASAKSLKIATAGFESLAADLLWLQAIQYTGLHAQDETFSHLAYYIQTITDIYPRFEYAYEFATFVIPSTNPRQADILAQKGLSHLPDHFQIAFNRAFIQFYYLNDHQKALGIITSLESRYPELKSLPVIKAALLSKLQKHELALAIWQERAANAKNQDELEFAQSRIIRQQGFITIKQAIEKKGKPTKYLREIIDPIPPSGSQKLEFIWNGQTVLLQARKR